MVETATQSEIDQERTDHINTGKLTSKILEGNYIYRTNKEELPVKKDALGVVINPDPFTIIILNGDGKPIAVRSNRLNWVKTRIQFNKWDDLKIVIEDGWYREFNDLGIVILREDDDSVLYHIPFASGLGRIYHDKRWFFEHGLEHKITGSGTDEFIEKIGDIVRENDPDNIDRIDLLYEFGMVLIYNKSPEFKFFTVVADNKTITVDINFKTSKWEAYLRFDNQLAHCSGCGFEELGEMINEFRGNEDDD